MEKHKTYEIDSLEKLCNVVTEENFERLTLDFFNWLYFYMNAINKTRNDNPGLCKGQSNWEVAECTFIWIDDGKNNLDRITYKDPDTGQVHSIDIKGEEEG